MTRTLPPLRHLALGILAALTTIGAAAAQPRYDRALQMHQVLHDGVPRSVGVYVPSSYRRGQPTSLIVALHGRFSSAQAFHAQSGLSAVAEARGALIAYPEVERTWNDGGHELLIRRFGEPEDDIGFIAAAVHDLSARYAIDAEQIYLVGYDSGGAMAYTLACQDGRYAGIAIVGPLMWDYQRDRCANARATPLLIVHGRRDEYAPVRGGDAPNTQARRLGVAETMALWRRVNGCGAPTASGRHDSAAYASCTSGAALAYVGVDGGNRDWFHTGDGSELNRQGVDATALVNAFFFERAAFSLPDARSRGRSRSWIVYAPPEYDPATPTPVVVLLHGRPSNGGAMALISDMNTIARENNFIVVYPDGLDNEWNAHFDIAASSISLTGRSSTLPQDDVGFLKTLMGDLALDFNIDRSRLYLGGFSNGAFMTHRMACSAGDTFAAFAAVGAALYIELSRYCSRGQPTPILLMHGTGDPSVPYEGVEVVNPQGGDPIRITLTVQETVSAFARRNHCSLSGTSTTYAESGRSPGTHVVSFVPHDCDSGADVLFYLINGGGHTWPGVEGVMAEEVFGPTNMDFRASQAIWDFFANHTLARR